jgi:hypothetical protein
VVNGGPATSAGSSKIETFCKDLYKFCPDIVDQGVGSVAALEIVIEIAQEVFLWWD